MLSNYYLHPLNCKLSGYCVGRLLNKHIYIFRCTDLVYSMWLFGNRTSCRSCWLVTVNANSVSAWFTRRSVCYIWLGFTNRIWMRWRDQRKMESRGQRGKPLELLHTDGQTQEFHMRCPMNSVSIHWIRDFSLARYKELECWIAFYIVNKAIQAMEQ